MRGARVFSEDEADHCPKNHLCARRQEVMIFCECQAVTLGVEEYLAIRRATTIWNGVIVSVGGAGLLGWQKR